MAAIQVPQKIHYWRQNYFNDFKRKRNKKQTCVLMFIYFPQKNITGAKLFERLSLSATKNKLVLMFIYSHSICIFAEVTCTSVSISTFADKIDTCADDVSISAFYVYIRRRYMHQFIYIHIRRKDRYMR
jgi:hypothetical protein